MDWGENSTAVRKRTKPDSESTQLNFIVFSISLYWYISVFLKQPLLTVIVSFLAPGPPVEVSVEAVSSTSLKVTWKSPDDPNGIITGFRVFYTFIINDLGEAVTNKTKVKEFSDNSTLEFVMTDLGMFKVSGVFVREINLIFRKGC